MFRKILPVLLTLAAFLGGAAAGDLLKPPAADYADVAESQTATDANAPSDDPAGHGDAVSPTDSAADAAMPAMAEAAKPAPSSAAGHGDRQGGHGGAQVHGGADPKATAWFKFPQQFFVPVLHDGQLDSTMILSLSAEMPGSATETVYAHEIKLRDALLRQLLIHANTGGFDGNFTAEPELRRLRAQLVAAAQVVVPDISDILIGDIARQER